MTKLIERVLYDDVEGTDLLIDDKHNVNLRVHRSTLVDVTHQTRDGFSMEVQFYPTFKTYLVMVSR